MLTGNILRVRKEREDSGTLNKRDLPKRVAAIKLWPTADMYKCDTILPVQIFKCA